MAERFCGDNHAARERVPNWPAWSLAVAVGSWVVGYGGYAFWDSRTVARPPLQADYGHDLGLLAVALLTLLVGPLIGMSLALRSMWRQPSRQLPAAMAFLLNFWVWGLPLLLTTAGSVRAVGWWVGVGIAGAGAVVTAYLVFWPMNEAGERRGFPVELTGRTTEATDE